MPGEKINVSDNLTNAHIVECYARPHHCLSAAGVVPYPVRQATPM